MENQDKLYGEFKNASAKAETKGFDRMEAVWNRVEEKLDNKKKRRGAIYWKYGSIAAMLILCLTVGSYFFRNSSQPLQPVPATENNVTVIDTQKINDAFNPAREEIQEEVVVNEEILKHKSSTNNKPVLSSFVEVNDDEIILSGIVTDAQGLPVPGAVINVKGKKDFVSADFDGKYSIKVKKGDVLSFSFMGMKSQQIVANNNKLSVQMQDDITVLNDVVVEGYRTTKRTTSNAAVTTVTTERSYALADKSKAIAARSELSKEKPKTAFVQSLQGQAQGIKIEAAEVAPTVDKSYKGNTTVVLRGRGSLVGNIEPLYVIDGVPSNIENFRKLNTNDIASVEVLKDAGATSVYGNRGSNGVVVVTTKRTKAQKRADIIKQRRDQLDKRASKKDISQKKFIPVDTEEYESFEENKFENTTTTPLSTFSIDVDNASYTNIRRFLNNGQMVPKDAVRVEEMINFFKYQYPEPKGDEPFSINTEYSTAPWNSQHKLLKIGLKGKEIPTAKLPASNFVFLIDVSGSMNAINKLPLLKQSMKLLVNQMREEDKIAIVVYAGAAGLVLPPTSGAEKQTIINALENLNAGGSTAGGAGIELAYKTAQENFVKGGNNRVILATDGDFNVGASSNSDMQTLIEEKRKSGVFLTCLGYGMGNYKDSKMEILADKGNGNYAYIDNMQEADRFLLKEFKGTMFAIAKDVKIQIEFNPKHVQAYRLIGYENRKLRDEDFVNDAIDAGELGSGHTVTALYEIIPVGVKSEFFTGATQLKYSEPIKAAGNYHDELATIKFRHKKPDSDKSKETVKVIPTTAVALQQASGDFKFAAAVAWFGLKLRDSQLLPNKETDAILKLAKQGLQNDPEGYRAEFVRLVNMVK